MTALLDGFVSAVVSVGYHVELASGRHCPLASFREKRLKFIKILVGVGIALNSLCINPRLFGFQFPLGVTY